ncbi:hypothetical protein AVEN_67187-1 [Araneus ventricosus]|uniref:Uncharacterized protein n=1 Tax=Araneus ventricosus TaxID=182803 RepID=A0A4Y2HDD9_ARAVE|nr:hypothetical protein AVEN_67187-1 [Araneus ventricosus]
MYIISSFVFCPSVRCQSPLNKIKIQTQAGPAPLTSRMPTHRCVIRLGRLGPVEKLGKAFRDVPIQVSFETRFKVAEFLPPRLLFPSPGDFEFHF